MNENTDRTVDEMLDWLCWDMADTAARFYPPQETRDACVEALDDPDDETIAMEYGQHLRALQDAAAFYDDLERFGFDPKARAERERQRAADEDDLELPEIDWEWYEALVGHERPAK